MSNSVAKRLSKKFIGHGIAGILAFWFNELR